MKSIFELLYGAHPAAPLLFLVLFVNGVAAPGLYTVFKKLPYSIGVVRKRASEGDNWAKYAYYSWLALATVVFLVVVSFILRAFVGGAS